MSVTPPRLMSALADRYHIERELGAGDMAMLDDDSGASVGLSLPGRDACGMRPPD